MTNNIYKDVKMTAINSDTDYVLRSDNNGLTTLTLNRPQEYLSLIHI